MPGDGLHFMWHPEMAKTKDMAGSAVPVTPVKKADSLFDELAEIERQLSKHAFELFENRGWMVGRDLDH